MSDTQRVPVEPTEEMGRVSGMRFKCHCGRAITQWAVNKWADMLAAAPPEDELARLERQIAVSSSICLIKCNSYETEDGWYELDGAIESHPPMADEPEIRYLEIRGLLERHPDNPNLVRVKEGEG